MSASRQPGRKAISTFWERVARFERENIEAARIILRDVNRYGGESAGLVIWARMVTRREVNRRREAA